MLMRHMLLVVVWSLLTLVGCGDDQPPIGPDASLPDMSDVGEDLGEDVGLDVSPDAELDLDPDADMDPDMSEELPPFEWPLPTGPVEITPHGSWKERISYWDDPFIFGDYNQVKWVKFAVLVRDPSRVIYQNSFEYPYHYDFAVERLNPFLGMNRAEFDSISLYERDQEVILGAVLFPPVPGTNELGIQLVRQDAYHPEMVRIVYELVKASIDSDSGPQSFYFPTFEQVASTLRWASAYQERAIAVSSVDRWLEGDTCYSSGWALGRLVYVPGSGVFDAYLRGDLLSTDILLTDGVPADLPHVAGIVSLTPGTPNSHVAILANSFQVPFVYLRSAEAQQEAMALVGEIVALRARSGFAGPLNCEVKLASATNVPPAIQEKLLELKKPSPIAYLAKQSAGSYTMPTIDLQPSDIVYVGGKAANFGILRRAVPDNSPLPVPIAFTFDLWDDFMDQMMPGGNTLRVEVASRLAPFTVYPPPAAALETALEEIRDMIRNQTAFTPAQETAVISALDGFDPLTRIRFRSSTNVEDSENFTGAGLYDSYSGCLADDLDADEIGPSHCDSSQSNERGVFRAIRRVYASFYNTRAFLERLRHGVNETEVAMGMVVHYSDPDETELANGVITVRRQPFSLAMTVVTQPGAASVTNPSDAAQPEIVEVNVYSFGTYATFIQGSELVPLGQRVLDWADEYEELAGYVEAVVDEFMIAHPGKTNFWLDLEYKKLTPGKLILRQVREIPLPPTSETLTPFLIGGDVELCTFQGEADDVFSNHRSKLRWNLGMRSAELVPSELTSSLVAGIDGQLLVDAAPVTLQGSPSSWTGAGYRYGSGQTEDSWTHGIGASQRTYALRVEVPTTVQYTQTPLLFPSDFYISFGTRYSFPQPYHDWFGGPGVRDEDNVRLSACPPSSVDGTFHRREVTLMFGASISAETHYWWPPSPRGISAGYTAPLVYFEQTRIDGLLAAPIVLDSYFSQTYRPEHHNFDENFYFDFATQPGITPAQLNELMTLDIRALVSVSGAPYAIGFDGVMRAIE